jgi:hypothetical protein
MDSQRRISLSSVSHVVNKHEITKLECTHPRGWVTRAKRDFA